MHRTSARSTPFALAHSGALAALSLAACFALGAACAPDPTTFRIAAVTAPEGFISSTYTYDAAGKLITYARDDGAQWDLLWSDEQLLSFTNGVTNETTTIIYADGRAERAVVRSASSDLALRTIALEYEPDGSLEHIVVDEYEDETSTSTITIRDSRFAYHPDGRLRDIHTFGLVDGDPFDRLNTIDYDERGCPLGALTRDVAPDSDSERAAYTFNEAALLASFTAGDDDDDLTSRVTIGEGRVRSLGDATVTYAEGTTSGLHLFPGGKGWVIDDDDDLLIGVAHPLLFHLDGTCDATLHDQSKVLRLLLGM